MTMMPAVAVIGLRLRAALCAAIIENDGRTPEDDRERRDAPIVESAVRAWRLDRCARNWKSQKKYHSGRRS